MLKSTKSPKYNTVSEFIIEHAMLIEMKNHNNQEVPKVTANQPRRIEVGLLQPVYDLIAEDVKEVTPEFAGKAASVKFNHPEYNATVVMYVEKQALKLLRGRNPKPRREDIVGPVATSGCGLFKMKLLLVRTKDNDKLYLTLASIGSVMKPDQYSKHLEKVEQAMEEAALQTPEEENREELVAEEGSPPPQKGTLRAELMRMLNEEERAERHEYRVNASDEESSEEEEEEDLVHRRRI